MDSERLLDELEAQIDTISASELKHDFGPAYEVMADWVRSLDEEEREAVLVALRQWLSEEDHRWHPSGAMQIAKLLRYEPLIDAAVDEARRRGVHDGQYSLRIPAWLGFHMELVSILAQVPTPKGVEYLTELRDQVPWATSHNRRLLAIRAWFTLCFLKGPGAEAECVAEGLNRLRRWNDEGVMRSGLGLLHAYFVYLRNRVDMLKVLLTPVEFAFAAPELVGR